MYDEFVSRADSLDDGLHLEAVTYHTGSRADILKRHHKVVAQALQQGLQGARSLAPHLLGIIADPRTLRMAWDHLETSGGSTPGENGHRYRDFDEHEVWSLMRALGGAIRTGTLRRGQDKKLQIPKGGNRGFHTLTISNIEDHVVERAAVEVLGPVLDPLFHSHSVGFRPGRDRCHALAMAERYHREGRRVWVIADVANAFDQVPLERLLQILRWYLPADALIQFVERLSSNGTKRGLRQGGPLSPLLLLVDLHQVLDHPWSEQCSDVPLIRVADDILLACRSRTKTRRVYQQLERFLTPAGMNMKDTWETSVHDLARGDTADWLGFSVSQGSKTLEVQVQERAWDRLSEHLALAHLKAHSPLRAASIIRAWISQMGPCYPSIDVAEAYEKIAAIARSQAFDEIPSGHEIREHWQRAYARWRRLRKRYSRPTSEEASPAGAGE